MTSDPFKPRSPTLRVGIVIGSLRAASQSTFRGPKATQPPATTHVVVDAVVGGGDHDFVEVVGGLGAVRDVVEVDGAVEVGGPAPVQEQGRVGLAGEVDDERRVRLREVRLHHDGRRGLAFVLRRERLRPDREQRVRLCGERTDQVTTHQSRKKGFFGTMFPSTTGASSPDPPPTPPPQCGSRRASLPKGRNLAKKEKKLFGSVKRRDVTMKTLQSPKPFHLINPFLYRPGGGGAGAWGPIMKRALDPSPLPRVP